MILGVGTADLELLFTAAFPILQFRVVQYGGFSIKYAYYTYLIAKIKYVRNTALNTAIRH